MKKDVSDNIEKNNDTIVTEDIENTENQDTTEDIENIKVQEEDLEIKALDEIENMQLGERNSDLKKPNDMNNRTKEPGIRRPQTEIPPINEPQERKIRERPSIERPQQSSPISNFPPRNYQPYDRSPNRFSNRSPVRPPFEERPPFGESQGNMPSGPPPRMVPRRTQTESRLFAVDPGAIWQCRYRYTYLWLENGASFWAWIMYVGRRSIAGYRWIGYRWIYFGTDLDNISEFICY